MLHIFFGHKKDEKIYLDIIFDSLKENEWFNQKIVEDMVQSIDMTSHVRDGVFDSPFLGYISSSSLSKGCKGCIMMQCITGEEYSNMVYAGMSFGDNCIPWILQVAEHKEVYMAVNHLFALPKDVDFKIEIENYGVIVHNSREFFNNWVRFRGGAGSY